MLPRLYKLSSDYSTTYIDTLTTCTSCVCREVRNGEYVLDLETTEFDDCAESILSQSVIGAKANPFDGEQLFEIYKTERTIDGKIKAYGKHIKNLGFQFISTGSIGATESEHTIAGTPKSIWDEIINNFMQNGSSNPLSFTSDITDTDNFSLGLNNPEKIGDILGGKEGSFLDVWGGEYHFDNFKVELLNKRGKNSNFVVRYGQNISEATQTESSESTYSHILPYGTIKDVNTGVDWNLYSALYEIPDHNSLVTKVFPLDCTAKLKKMTINSSNGTGYVEAEARMTSYATKYAKNNSLGDISVGFEVTLRAELDEMTEIGLCDTITVLLDNFGTTAKAKVTEVEFDSLLERWNKIVVGKKKITLADLILNKNHYI